MAVRRPSLPADSFLAHGDQPRPAVIPPLLRHLPVTLGTAEKRAVAWTLSRMWSILRS